MQSKSNHYMDYISLPEEPADQKGHHSPLTTLEVVLKNKWVLKHGLQKQLHERMHSR